MQDLYPTSWSRFSSWRERICLLLGYVLGPELIAIRLDLQLNFQQNDTTYVIVQSMLQFRTYVRISLPQVRGPRWETSICVKEDQTKRRHYFGNTDYCHFTQQLSTQHPSCDTRESLLEAHLIDYKSRAFLLINILRCVITSWHVLRQCRRRNIQRGTGNRETLKIEQAIIPYVLLISRIGMAAPYMWQ